MATFTRRAEIRWTDIESNFHILHSRYCDYCANARMGILSKYSTTMQLVQQEHIGSILFSEECIFKRELKFGDDVEIKIIKSNCRFQPQEFYK
jgi:acyl-CoA thioester hydrolase